MDVLETNTGCLAFILLGFGECNGSHRSPWNYFNVISHGFCAKIYSFDRLVGAQRANPPVNLISNA